MVALIYKTKNPRLAMIYGRCAHSVNSEERENDGLFPVSTIEKKRAVDFQSYIGVPLNGVITV